MNTIQKYVSQISYRGEYRKHCIAIRIISRPSVSLHPYSGWVPFYSDLPMLSIHLLNTLRPRQNGRHFADHTFKRIFLNENVVILIQISLKFVPKGPINNIPALVQMMAWGQPGDKPLSEAMMVSLLTHICVTWPQWVKPVLYKHIYIYI